MRSMTESPVSSPVHLATKRTMMPPITSAATQPRIMIGSPSAAGVDPLARGTGAAFGSLGAFGAFGGLDARGAGATGPGAGPAAGITDVWSRAAEPPRCTFERDFVGAAGRGGAAGAEGSGRRYSIGVFRSRPQFSHEKIGSPVSAERRCLWPQAGHWSALAISRRPRCEPPD